MRQERDPIPVFSLLSAFKPVECFFVGSDEKCFSLMRSRDATRFSIWRDPCQNRLVSLHRRNRVWHEAGVMRPHVLFRSRRMAEASDLLCRNKEEKMKKKIQSALVLALVGLLGASTPVSVMAKESEESASAELQPMQQESSETYILDSSDAYTPYDEDILPEIAHVNIAVPYDSKTVAQWLAPYRHQDPMALDVLGFFMTQSPASASILAFGLENTLGSLDDPNDTITLPHFWMALDYIDQCNQIRASEGLTALGVTYSLMAISMVQADASSSLEDHTGLFSVGENLSWGQIPGVPLGQFMNPFYGWYTLEKPSNGGHYQNIVNKDYTVTGFAVGTNNRTGYRSVFGQVFQYSPNGEPVYTTDQIRAQLQQYAQNAVEGAYLPKPPENTQIMFRMYNPNSGEHFYTAVLRERNALIEAGWWYEGIGWLAASSGKPVYRLYNENAGDHHYTMSEKERNFLITQGWKDEKIGWYSPENTENAQPLYRAYNPNAKAGSHNYTASRREQDFLTANGWKDEGIAWYGIPFAD